jgi:hypothetical protein
MNAQDFGGSRLCIFRHIDFSGGQAANEVFDYSPFALILLQYNQKAFPVSRIFIGGAI